MVPMVPLQGEAEHQKDMANTRKHNESEENTRGEERATQSPKEDTRDRQKTHKEGYEEQEEEQDDLDGQQKTDDLKQEIHTYAEDLLDEEGQSPLSSVETPSFPLLQGMVSTPRLSIQPDPLDESSTSMRKDGGEDDAQVSEADQTPEDASLLEESLMQAEGRAKDMQAMPLDQYHTEAGVNHEYARIPPAGRIRTDHAEGLSKLYRRLHHAYQTIRKDPNAIGADDLIRYTSWLAQLREERWREERAFWQSLGLLERILHHFSPTRREEILKQIPVLDVLEEDLEYYHTYRHRRK